ncbi:MAG: 3-phosphoshikimate 1-carboxyvinyltransferase [Clostridia bacterium]|nr:3-phosphoshikimate 1-carboxyvinyltransferase [Clostridia bacterium]
MNVTVSPSRLSGTVSAPPSKSYLQRLLFLEYLAGKSGEISLPEQPADDVLTAKLCLTALLEGKTRFDCGESGATLRFLIPVALVKGGKFSFTGKNRLLKRPNDDLFSALSSHGITVIKTDDEITVEGKLSAGKYVLSGETSSQYISALLISLSAVDGDSEITVTGKKVSAPYIDMTLETLAKFGKTVEKTANGYKISGNGRFLMPDDITVNGDWTNSAYMLVAGAINGKVTVTGLDINDGQGDKKIIGVLKTAGAKITVGDGFVTAESPETQLQSFSFDCEDTPDLFPCLAVLGACANGTTVLSGIKRLVGKESDRLSATVSLLSAFGVKTELKENSLSVFGCPNGISFGKINTFCDHRIAVAGAVLSTKGSGGSVITDAECVNKSYPSFFVDFAKIGGKTNV